MRNIYKHLAYVVIVLFLGALAYSQEKPAERATVAFSNPSKPGFLEVHVHNGGITIKGYNGKEIIIEARVREVKITKEFIAERARELTTTQARRLRETLEMKGIKALQEKKKRKTEGMKLIKPVGGTGLSVEEENNHMEVSVDSLRRTVDLTIQVPYSTSLDLSTHNNGDIFVEKVTGEIEVNNHNGALILTEISGSVVAHTFNGAVEVTFVQMDPKKPMSFSTWNGDIDVTLPSNVKANLKMKSERGDIYSDFEISMRQAPQKLEEDSREKGGKYRISFDRSIYGTIGGGGQELQFKTYNGDIFIRKAK